MMHAHSVRRFASPAVLVVAGGALALAVWVGGDHGFAIATAAFYLLAAAGAYLISRGRSDLAAIMRTDGDERQRGMDRDATAIAGLAMCGVAIVGTIVQSARGTDPSAFAWTAAAGGIAYVCALGWLHRWR
jgi:hypothetical protein